MNMASVMAAPFSVCENYYNRLNVHRETWSNTKHLQLAFTLLPILSTYQTADMGMARYFSLLNFFFCLMNFSLLLLLLLQTLCQVLCSIWKIICPMNWCPVEAIGRIILAATSRPDHQAILNSKWMAKIQREFQMWDGNTKGQVKLYS